MSRYGVIEHWFFYAAGGLFLLDVATVLLTGWSAGLLLEIGLVFDLVVVMPFLYFLCYRERVKFLAVRLLGLSCLGMWLLTLVAPADRHGVFDHMRIPLNVGLAILATFELYLIFTVVRLLSSLPKSTAEAETASRL
ncbi:MAG: hypothetical protein AAF991_12180, partial [Pseudomonadota bacterium]